MRVKYAPDSAGAALLLRLYRCFAAWREVFVFIPLIVVPIAVLQMVLGMIPSVETDETREGVQNSFRMDYDGTDAMISRARTGEEVEGQYAGVTLATE